MQGPRHLTWPNKKRTLNAADSLLLQRRERRFPVHPTELSELVGINWMTLAEARRLEPGLNLRDAIVVKSPRLRLRLGVLNPLNAAGRSLFNVMHEIGHVAVGHLDAYDIEELRNRRHKDPQAARTLDCLEREADIFATEVMMPGALVRALKPDQRELVEFFGASWEAAANRLTDRIEPTDLDGALAQYYREFTDEILAIRVFREQDRPGSTRNGEKDSLILVQCGGKWKIQPRGGPMARPDRAL